MRKQEIPIGEEGIGVKGDGGDLELPAERPPVQALDVGELVHEGEPLGVDAPLGEREEHEGVVGVGAVRDRDAVRVHGVRHSIRGVAPRVVGSHDAFRFSRGGGVRRLTSVSRNARIKTIEIARFFLCIPDGSF